MAKRKVSIRQDPEADSPWEHVKFASSKPPGDPTLKW